MLSSPAWLYNGQITCRVQILCIVVKQLLKLLWMLEQASEMCTILSGYFRKTLKKKLCISSHYYPPEAAHTWKHQFRNAWFLFLSSMTPAYSEANFTPPTKTLLRDSSTPGIKTWFNVTPQSGSCTCPRHAWNSGCPSRGWVMASEYCMASIHMDTIFMDHSLHHLMKHWPVPCHLCLTRSVRGYQPCV